MELDLEQAVADKFPWDFSLRIKSKSYPTRPLSLGDLMAVEQIQQKVKQNDLGSIMPLLRWIESLFPHEKPKLDHLQPHQLIVILVAILTQWRAHSEKNSLAAAAAITGAAEQKEPEDQTQTT